LVPLAGRNPIFICKVKGDLLGREFGCGGAHASLFTHRRMHMFGGLSAVFDRPNNQ
jgi:hypothetical protein